MTVDEFIADSDPRIQPLLEEIRVLLLNLHPMMTERIRYKIPFFDCPRMLFFLNPRKDRVELGFCNGAVLADENGLLTATDRKYIRHYIIRKPSDIYHEGLRSLLFEAIEVHQR
jgi:hypothetical protein